MRPGVDEQRRPGGTHKQFKLQIAGQFYYMRRNNSAEVPRYIACSCCCRFFCGAKKICALGISIATCASPVQLYTNLERPCAPPNQEGGEIPLRTMKEEKRHEIFIFVIEMALNLLGTDA